jgi:hypothetical protein
MSELSFDSDKLDVAFLPYNKCTEQKKYYELSDQLTFSRDQEQLLDWIQTKKED